MRATVRMMACAALLASARVASAEGNSPTAAQELFASAKADAKAEDYRAAVAKFSKSYRLDPKPGTLRNVAFCEEQLGRLASALRHYREVVEKFPNAAEHVTFASERAAELEKRVAWLTIKLAGGAPAGTRIVLDGDEVAIDDVRKPLAVDPGQHKIEVSAPGHDPATFNVKLAEAEKREQEVELGALATERAATAPQPREKPGSEHESANGRKTAAYVSLGIGGAALLGVAAIEIRLATGCEDRKCPFDPGTLQKLDLALFSVGVVGAGLGAYLLLSGGSEATEQATILRPAVGPAGGSLSIARTF